MNRQSQEVQYNMDMNRRKFLKLGGAAVAGLGIAAVANNPAVAAGVKGSSYQPAPGKIENVQWGMVIDMNKMDEQTLQNCIDVCHHFHNVPNIDTKKDEIKWIWGETYESLFLDEVHEHTSEKYKNKVFMTICNHCEEPVCVRVCPTKATFKNAQGVVGMDMHRCIGCRNCMAACPYGARSFNFKDPRPYIEELNPAYPTRMKGVVEKCNFCSERLAVGELPLCVEAAGGALVFGDISDPNSGISKVLAENLTIQRRTNLGTKPKVFYIV